MVEEETTHACENCRQLFVIPPAIVSRRLWWPKECEECQAKTEEACQIERLEAMARYESVKRSERWHSTICPPLYQESERAKLGITEETLNQILSWKPQAKGMGIAGVSGTGKTRAMFILLKELFFEGIDVAATSGKRFERLCHQMFDKDSESGKQIRLIREASILFIDDIGKEKYTERVESEFYDLVEYRTSHLLPILWTANASGQQLSDMMSPDRGTAIVRRLREFSIVISV